MFCRNERSLIQTWLQTLPVYAIKDMSILYYTEHRYSYDWNKLYRRVSVFNYLDEVAKQFLKKLCIIKIPY